MEQVKENYQYFLHVSYEIDYEPSLTFFTPVGKDIKRIGSCKRIICRIKTSLLKNSAIE